MPYKPLDMVERLRKSPSCREFKIGIDAETTAIWHDLCCEAANEIIRLTAELAETNGQVDLYKERIQQLYASHARKDVELARLRVEVEAWRSGRLFIGGYKRYPLGSHNIAPWYYVCGEHQVGLMSGPFETLNAAVDALMAEREEVTP